MKRGTFKPRKSGFKTKSTFKTKQGLKRKSRRLGGVVAKKQSKGLEAWLKAIPESQSHGSGTLQKRLWRVKSDYVRIRDWYGFNKKCVATGKILERWQDGQAGHFKAYSKCNGLYKFHENNIHLQGAQSNAWGDKDDWKFFENELIRRYGKAFVESIEIVNRDYPLRIHDSMVVDEIKRTLKLMETLPEVPSYYERVVELSTV